MKGGMLAEGPGLLAVTAGQVQARFRDHIAGRAPVEVVGGVR